MIDLNENGSRVMQLSLKTVYINLPEYIVNGFDFNRTLLCYLLQSVHPSDDWHGETPVYHIGQQILF